VLQKLLLISVVFASIIVPLWAAQTPDARRGLKKTVLAIVAFNVLYLLALKYLYWLVF